MLVVDIEFYLAFQTSTEDIELEFHCRQLRQFFDVGDKYQIAVDIIQWQS